jgi:SAM-dependent methyltransferase
MYGLLKNIAKKIIPRKWMIENEGRLRSVVSMFYAGKNVTCNICGRSFRKFIRLRNGELLCPRCGSLPRNRRLYDLLKDGLHGKNILDFSPSRCWYRLMKSRKDLRYTASDYSGEFLSDKTQDITRLQEPAATYDIVICYHVLEHVPDDAAAMAELHRVLKQGGQCFVQTPFREGDIYENPAITSPQERLAHFGQEDHVRVYSVQGLKDRLERQGFRVEILRFQPSATYGFNGQEVILKGIK